MPVMIVQENGSRNKRKFRADPLLADPSKAIPLPANEFTSFEFSAEKLDSNGHTSGCDMCRINLDTSDALKLDLGLSCTVGASEAGGSQPGEEMEASLNEFHDADWSDLTESELEELLLSNLDTIFKSATKKIIASGYSEEVASKAILRSGLWYGSKDTLSNIVDNTLAFLQSGQEMDPSREHYFEDLQQMEKYILAELVCLVREVRPFFSTGDAMWCLLISDMNMSHACAVDGNSMGSLLDDTASHAGSSTIAAQPQSSESNAIVPCKSNAPVACAHNCPSHLPNLAAVHGKHGLQFEAPKPSKGPNGLSLNTVCQNSTSNISGKPFTVTGTQTTWLEEKILSSRNVGITKREYILRQKSMHFEKQHQSHGSKGTSRVGKLSSFGGLVLDKKLKGLADSASRTAKNSPFKINKATDLNKSADSVSPTTGFNSESTFGLETIDHYSSVEPSTLSNLPLVPVAASNSLPISDTELSLTFPAKSIPNPMPISCNIEATSCSCRDIADQLFKGPLVPKDRKDEMIMKLFPQMSELQNQLQEWTEWANQKVMQAARRLSKDKAELKILKQEKEEVERLKKEKQSLEDNTLKKLADVEFASRKASAQVERATSAVRRLEVENVVLRREMESAKVSAAESASSCQEVLKREKRTMMKVQLCEKQKADLQEELSAENLKLTQMQQKLKQAKDAFNQVEDKLNQEEKAKEELLTQISLLRKEREQIEQSTQSKEDTIKLKAANNLQKYKEETGRLEKEISKLRLKTDSSKIAALRRGINGAYTNKLTDNKYAPALKKSSISCISKMMTTAELKDFTGNGDVKRERECVMCLSEEMSVVFLPCAHQVVCVTCNKLHENQGMKDCPSCRTPIQKRISVCYAHS